MKKKFFALFLSAFMVFNSFVSSFANPIVLGKVAEVSVIYGIGRIAMDLIGFAGGIADIIQLGGSIFERMSDKEKEDFKNNVNYGKDGFTYNKDNVESIIKGHLPSKGYHFMKPFRVKFDTHYYHDTQNNIPNIESIFNKHSIKYTYQGIDFEVLTYTYPYNSTALYYTTYYRVEGGNLQFTTHRSPKDIDIFFEVYVDNIAANGTATIKMDYFYYNFKNNLFFVQVDDKCLNCPHDDITLKDKYDYPSFEDQQYIEEKFPQYENDIPNLISPEEDDDQGSSPPVDEDQGSNGGSNGGSSSVVTPLPSFPNLENFDFSGIKFDSFVNMFENAKSKFPFSIPFDIGNILNLFKAEPKPPIFEVPVVGTSFIVDLTAFTPLVNIISFFVVIGWVVVLINFTRKIGG